MKQRESYTLHTSTQLAIILVHIFGLSAQEGEEEKISNDILYLITTLVVDKE